MAKYIFVTGGVTSSLGKGNYCGFIGKTAAGKGLKGYYSEV
jgi:CTP synthase (UTP-ammonia lyase)